MRTQKTTRLSEMFQNVSSSQKVIRGGQCDVITGRGHSPAWSPRIVKPNEVIGVRGAARPFIVSDSSISIWSSIDGITHLNMHAALTSEQAKNNRPVLAAARPRPPVRTLTQSCLIARTPYFTYVSNMSDQTVFSLINLNHGHYLCHFSSDEAFDETRE
ncbi:hypothetical protein J6590_081968 [Homalodisca vitripennis]|nr:hypothetical protein J6590_081968 [Homalodisca vitripennis]